MMKTVPLQNPVPLWPQSAVRGSPWALAAWLALAAVGPAHAAAPAASAAARPALTVQVTSATRSELPQVVAAQGTVHAWQEAVVGAEGAGWRLSEVRAQVGDVVRKGQVLARLDTRVAEAELAQMKAGVAEAEAAAAEAAANAQRARELQPSGALSAQQLTQFATAERALQARLEAQRAAVRAQELRLAQGEILAPDDGIVSARAATLGAVAVPGQELFRLIRQGRLEWRAEVVATDLRVLRPGQGVKVQPVGGEPVTGKVNRIAPTVDPATRQALVHVDLPAGAWARGLRAGLFARGEFEISRTEALTVPQTAVLLRDGHSWVFEVGADSKVRQLKVSTGRRVGDRVEILGGLPVQARVVVSGAGFLADGDLVRVVAAKAGS